MIVVQGKTCSGKDTIVRALQRKGFRKIVTYTTRPRRETEVDGQDYHFISKEEFQKKIEENFFIEWKTYYAQEGIWFYGTAYDDMAVEDENAVIIMTPSGIRDIMDKFEKKPTIIYIYANNRTITERLKKRGDSEREAKRRVERDNLDFKGAEYLADRIFYNNTGASVDKLMESIIQYIKEGNK